MQRPLSKTTPQAGSSCAADPISLLWAIPLAMWVPWRAFPVVRRMRLAPLLAVCLLGVAVSLAMAVYRFPWAMAGGRITWQAVVIEQLTSYLRQFAGIYVLLTLCAASRWQRVSETLVTGLKLALAAKASMYVFGLALFAVIGTPPPAWFHWFYSALVLYEYVAIAITAAWMADQEDALGDPSNPLWPQCIRCEYSLRGLPITEKWLEDRQAGTPAETATLQLSGECPECGLPIPESLHEHDLRTRSLSLLQQAWPNRPRARTVLLGLLSLRFKPLLSWLVHTPATTAVRLWLGIAAITTFAWLLWPGWALSPIQSVSQRINISPHYLPTTLLWTGAGSLLAGLWFSTRARRNVIYLAQRALIPGVCAAVCILAVTLANSKTRYTNFLFYKILSVVAGGDPSCMLLTPVVFAVAAILLRMLLRPMRSSQAHSEGSHPSARESRGTPT